MKKVYTILVYINDTCVKRYVEPTEEAAELAAQALREYIPDEFMTVQITENELV